MENLHIWKANEKTKVGTTKDASRGNRKITSINAISQLESATKQFGPYGKGFGLKEIDYNIIELSGGQRMAHLKSVFFYIIDNSEYSFPISSSIMISVSGKDNKQRVDADWAKKIETDVTTKALSKLGFNADVFKGQWDDDRYVQELREEEQTKEQYRKQISEMIQTKFIGEKETLTTLVVDMEPQEYLKWINMFNSLETTHKRSELIDRLENCKNIKERNALYSLLLEDANPKV